MWIFRLAGACLQHSGGVPASGAQRGEAAAPGTTDPLNRPRLTPENSSPSQRVEPLLVCEKFRSADPAVHRLSEAALVSFRSLHAASWFPLDIAISTPRGKVFFPTVICIVQ